MKYLISYRLFESIESYIWELVEENNQRVRYTFSDGSNRYLVEFKNIPRLRAGKDDLSTEYELSYYVYDESKEYYDVSKIVNINPYRTLKTILGEIVVDFSKRKSWVKKITMTGLAKDRERSLITQRTRMYVRYLERNPVPGFRLQNAVNVINLIKT